MHGALMGCSYGEHGWRKRLARCPLPLSEACYIAGRGHGGNSGEICCTICYISPARRTILGLRHDGGKIED